MNINEVRSIIRQTISEAIEEKKGGLPKSGGKLVHLKKELAGLKKMKESLGSYTINEGGDGQFVAEYAHMQKFVNELEKIKSAHAKLSEMLDSQISEVENKVNSETEKIKEMMGLIDKAQKDKKVKKESDPAGQKMAGNPDEEAESRSNAKSMAKAKSKPTDKPASKPAAKKNK